MTPAILEQGETCWYCGLWNLDRETQPCSECSQDEDFLAASAADLGRAVSGG